jgi:hypothetical protein
VPVLSENTETITLVGRSSAWGMRTVAPSLHNDRMVETRNVPQQVCSTWLHHRSYGTIGVYLIEPLSEQPGIPPGRQWLRAEGHIAPLRVAARPDDPRSAVVPELAPLLIALTAWAPVERSTGSLATHVPILPRPQSTRLLPARRCGRGLLAPMRRYSDLHYWQLSNNTLPLHVVWNRVVGVAETIGGLRFLRYVVRFVPEGEEKG